MHIQRNLILGVLVVASFLLFAPAQVSAQQDPQFSQYISDPLTINPAYAGSRDAISVIALIRDQWTGFDGAPQTRSLSVHSPWPKKRLGLGLSVSNDEAGPVEQINVNADFSYNIQVSQKGRLFMGIKAGMSFYQGNLMDLDVIDPGDAAFARNLDKNFLPNFGFGVYYKLPRFYAGISSPKLLRNKLDFKNNTHETSRVAAVERHYFLMTGGLVDINKQIKVKPSMAVKMVWGAPLSVDLTNHFIFRDQLWLGVSYRVMDCWSLIGRIYVTKQLYVGYAYDITMSDIRKYSYGSHEFMLGFDFMKFKRNKMISPRYF